MVYIYIQYTTYIYIIDILILTRQGTCQALDVSSLSINQQLWESLFCQAKIASWMEWIGKRWLIASRSSQNVLALKLFARAKQPINHGSLHKWLPPTSQSEYT